MSRDTPSDDWSTTLCRRLLPDRTNVGAGDDATTRNPSSLARLGEEGVDVRHSASSLHWMRHIQDLQREKELARPHLDELREWTAIWFHELILSLPPGPGESLAFGEQHQPQHQSQHQHQLQQQEAGGQDDDDQQQPLDTPRLSIDVSDIHSQAVRLLHLLDSQKRVVKSQSNVASSKARPPSSVTPAPSAEDDDGVPSTARDVVVVVNTGPEPTRCGHPYIE
jgi:hypothetical protein